MRQTGPASQVNDSRCWASRQSKLRTNALLVRLLSPWGLRCGFLGVLEPPLLFIPFSCAGRRLILQSHCPNELVVTPHGTPPCPPCTDGRT